MFNQLCEHCGVGKTIAVVGYHGRSKHLCAICALAVHNAHLVIAKAETEHRGRPAQLTERQRGKAAALALSE